MVVEAQNEKKRNSNGGGSTKTKKKEILMVGEAQTKIKKNFQPLSERLTLFTTTIKKQTKKETTKNSYSLTDQNYRPPELY